MADNLIVSDEYIKEVAKYIQKQGQDYDTMLAAYRNIVRSMCENGIKEGRIHDVLLAYVEAANCIDGEMKVMSSAISQKLQTFIDEIDEKDKYIY